MRAQLQTGDLVVVDLGHGVGMEQSGMRPAVVLSTPVYNASSLGLAIVVPCTSAARGWESHVPVLGDVRLKLPTFAMTEQVRAVSPNRICGRLGTIGDDCRAQIAFAVSRWILQRPRFEY